MTLRRLESRNKLVLEVVESLPSEPNADISQTGFEVENMTPEDVMPEISTENGVSEDVMPEISTENGVSEDVDPEIESQDQELPTMKELDKLNSLLDQIDAKLAELDNK